MEIENKILAKFFIRTSSYGTYKNKEENKKSSGTISKDKITEEKIKEHISGGIPIGPFAYNEEGKCLWVAFDLDCHKDIKKEYIEKGNREDLDKFKETLLKQANEIQNELDRYNIKYLLEDSVGGYHIWVFFEKSIEFSIARNFLDLMPFGCEKFPKQAKYQESEYGNFLRMPGKYHSTDDYCQVLINGKWHSTKETKTFDLIAEFPGNSEGSISKFIEDKKLEEKKKDEIKENSKSEHGKNCDKELKKIRILKILDDHFNFVPISNTFVCPFHPDTQPSAFIFTNEDGVDFYCCMAENCKYRRKDRGGVGGQTALGLIMKEKGFSFNKACSILGLQKPKGKQKECLKGSIVEEDGKTYICNTMQDNWQGETDNELEPFSNFICRIIERIVDDDNKVSWKILCKLSKRSQEITVSGEELNLSNKFCEKIAGYGEFLIETTSRSYHNMFVEHILEKSKYTEKRKTLLIGRINPNFFLAKNMIVRKGGTVEEIKNILPPEKSVVNINMPDEPLGDFWRDRLYEMKDLYGNNIWKIIGGATSGLFCNDLANEYGFFPLLFFNGPKGSGKSTAAELILSMFGAHREIKPFNINSTHKAWYRQAAKYSGMPLILNEFVASKRSNGLLQSLFDREGYQRAKCDNTLDTISTDVISFIIILSTRNIVGYESDAVRSRLVTLDFPKIKDDSDERKDIKEKVRKIIVHKEKLSSFIPVAMKIDPKDLIKETQGNIERINKEIDAEARLIDTHSFLLSGYNMFIKIVGGCDDLLITDITEDIESQKTSTNEANSSYMFINSLISLVLSGNIDHKIARINDINKLVFHLPTVYPIVRKFISQAYDKDDIPDEKTLKSLLEDIGVVYKCSRDLGGSPKRVHIFNINIPEEDNSISMEEYKKRVFS